MDETTPSAAATIDDPAAAGAEPRPRPPRPFDRWSLDPVLSARLALGAFITYLAVAGPLLLFRLGRYHWFFTDDWAFLAGRDGTTAAGYLEPHNGHLTAAPIAIFKVLYQIFGLNYRPYQAVLIAFHLAAVVLIRMVMRRAGVGPWTATVTASILVLFGAGYHNIVWAFQVTLVGAFAFGLVQLLLADHDGGVDRRDALAVGAGFLGLLFSGAAVTMVVVTGLTLALRGRWKAAAVQTVPLGVAYGVWYGVMRPPAAPDPEHTTLISKLTGLVQWDFTGTKEIFRAVGQNWVVGLALLLLLVVGLLIAWVPDRFRPVRGQHAAPAAMLIGVVVFLTSSGVTRLGLGLEEARASRYIYLSVALTLPALAVAASALIRRWQYIAPVVMVVLLAGIPPNIAVFGDHDFGEDYFRTERPFVLGMAHSPLLDRAGDLTQVNRFAPSLTAGWLRQARDDGKVPQPGRLTPGVRAQIQLALGLPQTLEAPPTQCAALYGPVDVTTKTGTTYGFGGGPIAISVLDAGRPSEPVFYDPAFGARLTPKVDGLKLRIQPLVSGQPFFCQ
jgi:hypothetical protein